MWTFLGLIVVAGVLWYWLRLAVRAMITQVAVIEAGLNRSAKNRGDKPISDDVDPRTFL